MAADQRGNMSTAPTLSPPARLYCPSFGKFPLRTKEHQCTQTIIWTVLDIGIQTTTLIRTRCPGLRWCEWSVLAFSLQWTRWFLTRPPLTSHNWPGLQCVFIMLFFIVFCVRLEFFSFRSGIKMLLDFLQCHCNSSAQWKCGSRLWIKEHLKYMCLHGSTVFLQESFRWNVQQMLWESCK